MGKEVELMREMWRLGITNTEGVTITCKSNAEAVKLRFTLYNAVRAFRDGKGEVDNTLRRAVDECQVVIGDDFDVTISQRIDTAVGKAMLELLKGKDVRDTKAVIAEESLARVMEKVAETQRLIGEAPGHSSQPAVNPGSKYGARG